MDANRNNAIEKIYRLALQDKEFDAALRKRLGINLVSNVALTETDRINEIYEWCIEQIMRRQGEEFYADFPIKELHPQLIKDYNRMERFWRKGDFYDFCLAMYQQIENMTNYICADPIVEKVASKMWAYPAYIKTGKDVIPTLENRSDNDYLIAHLLFPDYNNKDIPNYLSKSENPCSKQYAVDKMRIVVYFIGYKAEMKSDDFDRFKEICSLLYDLYQCRNTNHRYTDNPEPSEWEQNKLKTIDSMKSFYYSKFHGLLSQYVEFVKNGFPMNNKLVKYANSLETKPVTPRKPTPKVVGKIDLDAINDPRKRKKT